MTGLFVFESSTPRDSSTQIGLVVEHTSSWLTINPFKGCSLGCAYCFRARWHPSVTPQEETAVAAAVDALVSHRDFVPHETPVSINVSSTDALLPEVRESTFQAIRILEQRQLRNPFGIVTKLSFTRAEISQLQALNYLRPIVFISLAFLPLGIEPVGVEHRISTMAQLSRAGVPVVHYYRPIILGWNDSNDIIRRVMEVGGGQCQRHLCGRPTFVT